MANGMRVFLYFFGFNNKSIYHIGLLYGLGLIHSSKDLGP